MLRWVTMTGSSAVFPAILFAAMPFAAAQRCVSGRRSEVYRWAVSGKLVAIAGRSIAQRKIRQRISVVLRV